MEATPSPAHKQRAASPTSRSATATGATWATSTRSRSIPTLACCTPSLSGRAMTDAAELTRRLGGTWHDGRHGYGTARCPAHDDTKPSLSIRDGDTRLLVHCHTGCDPHDVLDALRRRGLIDDYDLRRRPKRREISHVKHLAALDRAALARWLWSRRKPITGSIAERYLRQVRGYIGPLPATLAFLAPSKPEHHPAMIAAFAVPDEPEPGVLGEARDVNAVHLTLLKPDGSGKADVTPTKLFIGSPHGRAIVLAPPNDLLGLAITEGIEDALSIHQATGLGAWAAGSAGTMPVLAVPDYIACVTICAHPDAAGQKGALALADALAARGIEVLIQGCAV
jgi:Toprim domain